MLPFAQASNPIILSFNHKCTPSTKMGGFDPLCLPQDTAGSIDPCNVAIESVLSSFVSEVELPSNSILADKDETKSSPLSGDQITEDTEREVIEKMYRFMAVYNDHVFPMTGIPITQFDPSTLLSTQLTDDFTKVRECMVAYSILAHGAYVAGSKDFAANFFNHARVMLATMYDQMDHMVAVTHFLVGAYYMNEGDLEKASLHFNSAQLMARSLFSKFSSTHHHSQSNETITLVLETVHTMSITFLHWLGGDSAQLNSVCDDIIVNMTNKISSFDPEANVHRLTYYQRSKFYAIIGKFIATKGQKDPTAVNQRLMLLETAKSLVTTRLLLPEHTRNELKCLLCACAAIVYQDLELDYVADAFAGRVMEYLKLLFSVKDSYYTINLVWSIYITAHIHAQRSQFLFLVQDRQAFTEILPRYNICSLFIEMCNNAIRQTSYSPTPEEEHLLSSSSPEQPLPSPSPSSRSSSPIDDDIIEEEVNEQIDDFIARYFNAEDSPLNE